MKIQIIEFNNAKLPERAHYNDSGADVFSTEEIILKPHSVFAVPLGIGLILPDGYDVVIHCKSGLSTKGIWAANAPIDAGYRGEIHAILYNTTDKEYKIEKGAKVGQMVLRPVIYAEFVNELGKKRFDAGFGSTGK